MTDRSLSPMGSHPRRLPPAPPSGDAPLAPSHYVDIPAHGYEASEDLQSGGLADYWRILRRRKGALILIAFLGLLVAFLVTLPQTPVYQARTSLEIQNINQDFLNMRQVNPVAESSSYGWDTLTDIQTQIKILQSNSLLERVVDRLKVKTPADLKPDSSRISAWRKALNLPEPPPLEARAQALGMASGSLRVRASGQTRIVEVLVDSTDPRIAASFANTLTNEFIEQNLDARWKMNQRTGEWLSRQLEDMRIKLERSEDGLQAYARRSGLMFTGEKTSVSEEKLRQLQQELSRAQADRIARQSRFEMVRSSPLDSMPGVLNDGSLRDYQTKLADLRRQLAELASVYTPAHYRVKRVQVQIDSLESILRKERDNVLTRIRREYEEALRREKLLSADHANQARLVNQESEKAIQYNILKREVDSNRQLYDSMLQRVKESAVASALRASNIRIVDPAKPPSFPYKPSIFRNASLGLLAGLFLGVAFIIARERADRTIQEPGDLNFYTGMPELGVIPSAHSHTRFLGYYRPRRNPLKQPQPSSPDPAAQQLELVTWQRKPSVLAESFRSVLTSIMFSSKNGQRPHVLVLTSPTPREGKTTIASNLAIALAEINQRVVLIDADLRKSRLHEIFGLDNERGLSTFLQQRGPITDELLASLLRCTQVPGLSIIPGGPSSASAANLLYSPLMLELIQRLQRDHDMVLFDTPPMLQIPDARVLGRLSDGVILVTRSNLTTRDAVLAARQRLSEDGTPVLGTILNDWNPKAGPGRYYSGYYKGYYKGYSHYYHGE